MALNYTANVKPVAEHAKDICDRLKQLHYDIKELLDTNSDKAIDWAAGSLPAYINEDASGNLDGLGFSRTAMANVIGSLDNVRKVLDNEAVSQGDHLGNINQLASSDAP